MLTRRSFFFFFWYLRWFSCYFRLNIIERSSSDYMMFFIWSTTPKFKDSKQTIGVTKRNFIFLFFFFLFRFIKFELLYFFIMRGEWFCFNLPNEQFVLFYVPQILSLLFFVLWFFFDFFVIFVFFVLWFFFVFFVFFEFFDFFDFF